MTSPPFLLSIAWSLSRDAGYPECWLQRDCPARRAPATLLRERFGGNRSTVSGQGAQGMRLPGALVLQPPHGDDSAQNQKLVDWVKVFKALHAAPGMLQTRLEVRRG